MINELTVEFNDDGKLTHFVDFDGRERKVDYDEDGNISALYLKEPDYEAWYTYDEDGTKLHAKTNEGYEIWHEYNMNGFLLYSKNHFGEEGLWERDRDGKILNYIDNDNIYWDTYYNQYKSSGEFHIDTDEINYWEESKLHAKEILTFSLVDER